jgi:predicted metal-dependent hydrolase
MLGGNAASLKHRHHFAATICCICCRIRIYFRVKTTQTQRARHDGRTVALAAPCTPHTSCKNGANQTNAWLISTLADVVRRAAHARANRHPAFTTRRQRRHTSA